MAPPICPPEDTHETDPSKFWDDGNITWKRHYIGWAVAGFCAIVASVISFYLMYRHARNYNKPSEQRHIVRIVFMIPIYSIISWCSYRWYHEAIYYETIRDCYEAFVIHSFFMLLLTYLGDSETVRASKMTNMERRKLVFPLNCFYYNPQSDHFLHYMKYGILQYTAIRPITTLAAVVLQATGRYCESSYSPAFGHLWIVAINFASVTVAMYCLVLLYITIKEDIAEHKPLLKFLCVKLVVFFCFWQLMLLSILGAAGVFQATEYWSVHNIEVGISAILIDVEMVIFAILHVFSFSYKPYVVAGTSTYVGKSLRDCFNPIDALKEIGWAFKDVFLILRGKTLPVREGHLSGQFQRANTVRAKNRRNWLKARQASKEGKGRSEDFKQELDEDDGPMVVKVVSPQSLPPPPLPHSSNSGHQDAGQQAQLLRHIDGRNMEYYPLGVGQPSYEMMAVDRLTPSPPPPFSHARASEMAVLQQQQQNQEHLIQQQQVQPQQYYTSRPADGTWQ